MAFVAVILSAVAWGVEFILIRVMLRETSASCATFYTYFATTVLLLLWSLGARRISWRRIRPNLRLLFVIGLVGAFVNIAQFKALDFTDPTSAAVIQRIQILFAIILGWIALRELPRWADLPAMAAMAFGFLALELQRGDISVVRVGNLMVLGSALGLAVNALLIKKLLRSTTIEMVSTVNSFLIMAWMLVLALATRGQVLAILHNPKLQYLTLAMGLFAAMSFLLYYFALRELPLWLVSIMLLLIPVTSAILQVFVLKEDLAKGEIAGMLLISAGAAALILLHQRRANRDSAAPPDAELQPKSL
ncbi:MAG: DMT family transporter [Planctomycetota bacterium]